MKKEKERKYTEGKKGIVLLISEKAIVDPE